MKNKLILGLVAVVSLVFLTFIYKTAENIQHHEKNLASSVNVRDVTKLIATSMLVTARDMPPLAIDEKEMSKIQIPGIDLTKHPEFKDGNFVYYRIQVPHAVFNGLSHLKNQVDLSLGMIHLKSYDLYLNGAFYRSHQPASYAEARQVLPLKFGADNTIIIKSKISSGDLGIYHRNKILAGKAGELYGVHLEGYKGDTVFPLIFILCKGSIFFLFTLIYLLMNVGKFFEKSLLFSICTLGEDVLAGDFLTSYLDLKYMAYLHNLLNFGSHLFLFLFIADVLGYKPKKKLTSCLFGLVFLGSTGVISDALFFNKFFGFEAYLLSWNLVSIAVLVFFLPKVLKVDLLLAFPMTLSLFLNVLTITSDGNIGLNFKMFGNLILFFMVGYQSFALFRKEQLELEAKKIQLLEQEKDVAIGKTASLLAHDVRRPLEQMKLILEKVTAGEVSPDFIRTAKNDVEFSLTSVNNQINDIMSYSKTRTVQLSDISLYRVLSGSLKQVMTISKCLDIRLTYELKARTKVLGDESRLASALTNLISNAVEAIRDIGLKTDGAIKIGSRSENGKFILSIFNDGPHIPESFIEEVWKPLFTHGKEYGTGLGLASVLRTVQDHGGSIKVRNIDPVGVEFELVLQASPVSDLAEEYEFHPASSAYSYESPVLPESKLRPLRIFLLDDDVQVHEYFQFLVKNLPFDVDLTFVSHYEMAPATVKAKRFDLYILDYDLGAEKTGEGFHKEHLGHLSDEVVIHSNRDLEKSHQQIKKPMAFEDLQSVCESVYAKRLRILLVDDSELTLMAWEMFHGSHNIQVCPSPESALLFLEKESTHLDVCVTDYYFDNSQMRGEDLARKIEALKYSLKVVVASNSALELQGRKTIEKNAFDVRGIF